LDKLKEKNIKVHIRSVFLQGMFYLSDKVIENKFKDALPVIKELRSIAKKEELTLAELSLLWVMSLDQVDKVIIGVDNIDQLIAHINTLNKNINPAVFEKALSINYENEEILNPSLWETQS
jgi:aryl-alcohol dehydrogenase-like predicted oxidoreductase